MSTPVRPVGVPLIIPSHHVEPATLPPGKPFLELFPLGELSASFREYLFTLSQFALSALLCRELLVGSFVSATAVTLGLTTTSLGKAWAQESAALRALDTYTSRCEEQINILAMTSQELKGHSKQLQQKITALSAHAMVLQKMQSTVSTHISRIEALQLSMERKKGELAKTSTKYVETLGKFDRLHTRYASTREALQLIQRQLAESVGELQSVTTRLELVERRG